MPLRIKGNPYLAGTGSEPPHLAGRENEKSEIDFALDKIKGQPNKHGRLDGVCPPLVLIGPRGVGKTVMLGWSKQRADELGVNYAVLTEKLLGGPGDELGVAVLGEKEYNKAVKGKTTTRTYGHPLLNLFGIEGQTTHPTAVLGLSALLNRSLKEKPMLLILDEAHAVAPELLKEFCVVAQGFIDESRPLSLVMAGTPGLYAVLRGIKATFMERAEFISMNLLAKEETREALSFPAADTGVPMDDDALEALVEWSDCYPFFIQQAGRFAWDVAKGRGASKITMEDANQALELAGQKRVKFYNGRYQELDKGNVVEYALHVIDLIKGQPGEQVSYQELIDGIKDANKGLEHEKVVEIYEDLMNLGFINMRDDSVEAGIPSLFDYVRDQKKPKRNEQ